MEKTNGVGAFKIIAGVVLSLALILGLVLVSGGMQYVTAAFRGEVAAEERTQGGDYRIAAYEQFYDLCAAIQADEDRLDNILEEKETADEARQAQLDTTLTAVRNSRAEKVRNYNADARKEATQGQFRDSGLPYELDIDEETTCHAEDAQ